jgi:methionyl aminopeptidase
MALTVEPMVNLGGAEVRLLDDGWTVVTADVVLPDGHEILTQRSLAAVVDGAAPR